MASSSAAPGWSSCPRPWIPSTRPAFPPSWSTGSGRAGYTSYVGPENFKIGQQDGQYIVDRLGGKGTVVVLKGGPADNSIGLNRTNGMLDIVSKVPGITVINAPDLGRLE